MSNLVRGVLIYRHIPPPSEMGATVHDLVKAVGTTERSVQRALATFEAAGLAKREPRRWVGDAERWWRA